MSLLTALPPVTHQTGAYQHGAVSVHQLLGLVRPGLQQVETKMKSVDSAIFAPLANAFLDLIGSGGKRLRPALALLAAEVGAAHPYANDGAVNGASARDGVDGEGDNDAHVVALASAVEMLHTATLVHDDVIDGALLRRGAPTLNAVWNGGATVLAGNYMFGAAALFSAQTNNQRVIRLFSETLKIIVDGELRQLRDRYNYEQEKSAYYQRIYAKTASLFCAATEGAAILAGLSELEIKRLRDYGYYFGMAFQIMDDVLDFTSNEATLGKPAGSDLLQGTLTLPFFYYLRQHAQPESIIALLEEERARADSEGAAVWRTTVARLVSELQLTTAITEARQEALNFLAQAKAALEPFPNTPHKEALLGLCDFVVQRSY